MKNNNKIIRALILAIPLLVSLGCSKFLDRQPQGTATEDDITSGGVEEQVYGLYGALRNWGVSDFPHTWFKSIRSDDASKGSSPGDLADAGAIMDNFNYATDHWLLNTNWDDHFAFIYQCNKVIHAVDSANLTDPASQVNKAEAQFLRALIYFDLVRDYGEVPLVTNQVLNPADANKPKSTVPELYALIDADLDFAIATLPEEWEARFIGRATKYAALGISAKTKLYRQDWAGALARAEEVINSGRFALVTPYYKLFKEEGENSSESLFEIQMHVNPPGNPAYGNSYNQTQGVRGSGDWDLGWGFNVPTQELVTNGWEAGDPRRDMTILYSGQVDGGTATGGYGRTVPASPPLDHKYWNKKVYPDPVRRAALGNTDARFAYWLNIPVLRYADLLLIAAEAANELGDATNKAKALEWLEMVRARARNGAAGILPAVVEPITQADLRIAIQKERRAELAMEGERFYDLVRWGLGETVLGPLGYQTRNKWYPIPQPNIDRSNGVLVQNPDY